MHKRCPVSVNPVRVHPEERRISLDANADDGPWKFRLDPDARGLAEHWYRHPELFTEQIAVPGTWQGQGFGSAENDYVWDFRIETRTLRATYRGTGWYCRRFQIPAEWRNTPGLGLWIAFGGVHPSAEVWVNGGKIGNHGMPFAPFALFAGEVRLLPAENNLVVRVHEENRELGGA